MRRLLFTLILICFPFANSNASDAGFYNHIFKIVKQEYITPVTTESLALAGLDGLNVMDDKFLLSNGAKTISIYYNGKPVHTYNKPINPNDVDEWSDFMIKVISSAKKYSLEISKKDFEIDDYVLKSMFSSLDKDTRYNPYLELQGTGSAEHTKQRYFAERYLDDNILYMKLGPLNLHTRNNILSSFEKNKDFEGLIIDLRGNPGGLLSEAISVMRLFLDNGIIASFEDGGRDAINYYLAEEEDIAIVGDKPIIILVDENTASSAEILAAGLKEQSLAKVVGTQTKGKGTIQNLIILPNGGELFLTSANFFTPSGRSVSGGGVLPNFCTQGISDFDSLEDVFLYQESHESRACRRQPRAGYEIDIDIATKMLN